MWALAALRHAGESGDGVWLAKWLPKIRRAVGWVLSYAKGLPQCRFAAIPATAWPAGDEPDGSVSYCASHLAVPNATAPKLISAPGPLWNVPFDMKGNMSADSNAIAVILLRELADAEQFVANASGAATLRAAADTLSGALQALWRHDHFASQIGVDGSEKDWVDNDANFLAIAAGAATPTQAAAFAARFGRGMGGRCKRPTWVVERPPCGTGANGRRVECPDARVSEARVAWTEALARDAMGDTAALRTRLVEPLRTDVLRDTWLSERYSCDGAPIRTPYFFEYPSLLAILLREFHYGLRLRVGTVASAPPRHAALLVGRRLRRRDPPPPPLRPPPRAAPRRRRSLHRRRALRRRALQGPPRGRAGEGVCARRRRRGARAARRRRRRGRRSVHRHRPRGLRAPRRTRRRGARRGGVPLS